MAREKLSSRLGFLLTTAGCAVGLGNVWRFPFIVGRNGGAVFVLIYLLFLALIGIPVLMAELAAGRAAKRGIAGAMGMLAASGGSAWRTIGRVVFLGNVLLMMYYTGVSGWLLRYMSCYFTRGVGFVGDDTAAAFTNFIADPVSTVSFMVVAILLAAVVCSFGLVGGVERVSKWMMLCLLGLLSVLALHALTLPNAMEGVKFYLQPNFAPFLAHPIQTCCDAMGQAFFTLSLGIGCMTTFGSYVDSEHSLVKESIWIVIIDTLVALLAGLVIFPVCAAHGVDVNSGPQLIFVALPKVFAAMPLGALWGGLFFLFMSLAAMTTIIAVFECIIGTFIDEFTARRRFTTIGVALAITILSLPATLGYNLLSDVHLLPGKNILDFEDYILSQLFMPIGAIIMCIFVTSKFGWGADNFIEEVSRGKGIGLSRKCAIFIKWVLPFILFLLFIGGL